MQHRSSTESGQSDKKQRSFDPQFFQSDKDCHARFQILLAAGRHQGWKIGSTKWELLYFVLKVTQDNADPTLRKTNQQIADGITANLIKLKGKRALGRRKRTSVAVSTVRRAISELCGLGVLIKVERPNQAGVKPANELAINWTTLIEAQNHVLKPVDHVLKTDLTTCSFLRDHLLKIDTMKAGVKAGVENRGMKAPAEPTTSGALCQIVRKARAMGIWKTETIVDAHNGGLSADDINFVLDDAADHRADGWEISPGQILGRIRAIVSRPRLIRAPWPGVRSLRRQETERITTQINAEKAVLREQSGQVLDNLAQVLVDDVDEMPENLRDQFDFYRIHGQNAEYHPDWRGQNAGEASESTISP